MSKDKTLKETDDEYKSLVRLLNKTLRIHNVVGRSEQLVCECKDEWIGHIDNFSDRMYCKKCGKSF